MAIVLQFCLEFSGDVITRGPTFSTAVICISAFFLSNINITVFRNDFVQLVEEMEIGKRCLLIMCFKLAVEIGSLLSNVK